MSVVSGIVLSAVIAAAKRVGAPLVKSLLEKHVGGAASDIGGQIIDAIAEKADVSPVELEDVAEEDLDMAVASVEHEAPELVAEYVKSQQLAVDLMKAEMDKGGDATWTWAWRPFWMWLLAALWLYGLVLRPLANAALGATIEGVDLPLLMTLTGMYLALYMGGHTVKDFVKEKWGGSK